MGVNRFCRNCLEPVDDGRDFCEPCRIILAQGTAALLVCVLCLGLLALMVFRSL